MTFTERYQDICDECGKQVSQSIERKPDASTKNVIRVRCGNCRQINRVSHV